MMRSNRDARISAAETGCLCRDSQRPDTALLPVVDGHTHRGHPSFRLLEIDGETTFPDGVQLILEGSELIFGQIVGVLTQ